MTRHRRPRPHPGRGLAVRRATACVLFTLAALCLCWAVQVTGPLVGEGPQLQPHQPPAPRCVDEPMVGPSAPGDGRVWWTCRTP